MDWLTMPRVGLILNFIGTVMVAISIGKLPPEGRATTWVEKQPYEHAMVLYPQMFRAGLALIGIGFLFQLPG